MAPPIPSAKLTLSYPLYACDFDPTDSSKLVVGGGGGAGRSGVENRITVVDTSSAEQLHKLAEADLRKDEDNPTSLAFGPKTKDGSIIFAGLNSSAKDKASGRNQHFRAFSVRTPEKPATTEKSIPGVIQELGRSTLFANKESDTYQRVLRLSRPYDDSIRLGAVATGLARESEIVVFDTSKPPGSIPNIRGRVDPGADTADIDIIQTGPDEFKLAYCTDKDVYLKTISSKTDTSEPLNIFRHREETGSEKLPVPAFRSLRWMSPDFLLMLINLPSSKGVLLQILRIRKDIKAGGGTIALTKKLPSSIKKATGLSVVNLTPPLTLDAPQENAQFAIAVASQDISISLYTVEYIRQGNFVVVVNLNAYKTIKVDHPLQMTSIAFSTFTPPPHPVSSTTGPQYIKLASASMGNTLVVHTLPISPLPISLSKGQSRTPRYVLALPSNTSYTTLAAIITFFLVLIGAILTQAALEIRGGSPAYLGAVDLIGPYWMERIGAPYTTYVPTHAGPADPKPIAEPQDALLTPSPEHTPLADLLAILSASPDGVVFVREHQDAAMHETNPSVPTRFRADLYDERIHGPHGGKTWEELSEEQREGWLERLKAAGERLEGEAAKVLKGVVFGTLGRAVGGAVGN